MEALTQALIQGKTLYGVLLDKEGSPLSYKAPFKLDLSSEKTELVLNSVGVRTAWVKTLAVYVEGQLVCKVKPSQAAKVLQDMSVHCHWPIVV